MGFHVIKFVPQGFIIYLRLHLSASTIGNGVRVVYICCETPLLEENHSWAGVELAGTECTGNASCEMSF
jgi:hypothetical protein